MKQLIGCVGLLLVHFAAPDRQRLVASGITLAKKKVQRRRQVYTRAKHVL
jgi:hypothetical protein